MRELDGLGCLLLIALLVMVLAAFLFFAGFSLGWSELTIPSQEDIFPL